MPGDMGTAYIEVHVPEMPEIGDKRLMLPHITNIEAAYYANLSEQPTIVMGFRNNFIIDLGTTLKLSLTMKRVNPRDYNDSSRDPEEWSNGKWYRYLEGMLDYWQNFGHDGGNNMTGGFHFVFTPSDTSLYPVIDRNVFLNGSLSLQYSVQYMVVQMNLTVARMQDNATTVRYVTIICYGGDGVEPREVQALADTPVRVPNPQDWGPIGYTLDGWATSPNGPKVYDITDTVTWAYSTTPYELYAIWTGGPKLVKYWDTPVQNMTYSVGNEYTGDEPISSVRVLVVGGGGGAGGGAWGLRGDAVTAGGAGGGGEYYYGQWLNVTSSTVFTITVGSGGSRGNKAGQGIIGSNGDGGSSGSISVVTSTSGQTISVRGGGGGAGGTHRGLLGDESIVATGGVSVFSGQFGGDASGGSSGAGSAWERGQNGLTYSPNVDSNAGVGALNGDTGGRDWGGGAGGGAAGFNYTFQTTTETYEFASIGGDAYNSTNGSRREPKWGGGGGSAYGYPDENYAQDGADGLVVLVFY